MVSIPQFALRGAQAFFMLVALALVGNAIAVEHFGNPGVNYAIFAAVFAWIAILVGLAAAFVESLAQLFILGPLDGLATIFTLIAGIVLAAQLGVHSCSNRSYLDSNKLTQGSEHRCRELQAACFFFWFAFAFFAGSLIMDFMGGSSSMSRRGGLRKGGPTMSQV